MPSMPSKNADLRLQEILDNIDAVREFTGQGNFDDFASDRKTLYAVVRALEIISEATRRLPAHLKCRHPEIDWVAIAASGNIYRHEYEGVDDRLIWHTVQHDLDSLRGAIASELDRLA